VGAELEAGMGEGQWEEKREMKMDEDYAMEEKAFKI
jgi:hypothetical protein